MEWGELELGELGELGEHLPVWEGCQVRPECGSTPSPATGWSNWNQRRVDSRRLRFRRRWPDAWCG